MPRFTLIWTDNSITTGETYKELEEAIRASQWSTFKTRLGFRRAIVRRARVWSDVHVSVLGTSRQFIGALARTDSFMIIDDQGEAHVTE